jgi:hypothetical protein
MNFYYAFPQNKTHTRWPCTLKCALFRSFEHWVRGFLIPLGALIYLRVYSVFCVVLCRQKPCDGPISHPWIPAIYLKNSYYQKLIVNLNGLE